MSCSYKRKKNSLFFDKKVNAAANYDLKMHTWWPRYLKLHRWSKLNIIFEKQIIKNYQKLKKNDPVK